MRVKRQGVTMQTVLESTPEIQFKDGRVSIYQHEQADRIFPTVPEFSNSTDERRHLKERLVASCRAFALHGLDYGFAGHLTVRDPEHPDLYWTNPMAVHFSKVKVSNLLLADNTGRGVEGRPPSKPTGFCFASTDSWKRDVDGKSCAGRG